MQVTQLVAQNFTNTTLPRRSSVLNCSFFNEVKPTSGAVRAGAESCHASRPTRTMATTIPIFSAFIGRAWFELQGCWKGLMMRAVVRLWRHPTLLPGCLVVEPGFHATQL